MARRRSYYGTKHGTSPRRILLYTAVIAVVAVAGWQYYQQMYAAKPSGDGDLGIQTPAERGNSGGGSGAVPSGGGSIGNPIPGAGGNTIPSVDNIDTPVNGGSNGAPGEVVPSGGRTTEKEETKTPLVDENVYHPEFSAAVMAYNSGVAAMEAGKVLEARALLSEAVKEGLPWETEKLARTRLNDLAKRWLFSRDIFEGDKLCERYRVQSGDYLSTIGEKNGVPYQFLMRMNSISRPENLRAGENIKIVTGPFSAVADRGKFIITVYLGDIIAYTWPISTGREGRATPTGKWRVAKGKKLMNPEWPDPDTGKVYLPDDPDNPLGERWIGIEGIEGDALGRTGFGIHGTIEPEKIGQAASRGCIRLREQDVEVLYDMLLDGVSIVEIKD